MRKVHYFCGKINLRFYIDGSKFEANANKYTWVWKKATEKFRYKLYEKITAEIEEINAEIAWSGGADHNKSEVCTGLSE